MYSLLVATNNDFPEIVALLLAAGANFKIENAFKVIPRLEAKYATVRVYAAFSSVC